MSDSTQLVRHPGLDCRMGIVVDSADQHIKSVMAERLGRKQQLMDALEEHQAQAPDTSSALFNNLLSEYAGLLKTEAVTKQRLSTGQKQLNKELEIQDRLYQHMVILDQVADRWDDQSAGQQVPQEMLQELSQVQQDIENNCQQLTKETASNAAAAELLAQIEQSKIAIEEMVQGMYQNNHKAVGLLQTELLEFGIRNADLEVRNLELHSKVAKLILSKDQEQAAQTTQHLKLASDTQSAADLKHEALGAAVDEHLRRQKHDQNVEHLRRQVQNKTKTGLVKARREGFVSGEVQNKTKAGLVKARMEGVSEEVQNKIKAGLVKAQMEGVVSKEVQDRMKAGLVRTQMDGVVSEEVQDRMKAGLVKAQDSQLHQPSHNELRQRRRRFILEVGLESPRTPEAGSTQPVSNAVLLKTPRTPQGVPRGRRQDHQGSEERVSSLSRAERKILINNICDRYNITKQPETARAQQARVAASHGKPVVPLQPHSTSSIRNLKAHTSAATKLKTAADIEVKTNSAHAMRDTTNSSSTPLPSQGLWDFLQKAKETK